MKNPKMKYIVMVYCFLLASVYAQAQKTISGTVKLVDGTPVSSVNVVVETGDAFTITDPEGGFSIKIKDLPVTLVFEKDGFQPFIGVYTSESNSIVVVLEKEKEMEHVPYGQLPANQVSASVYTISGEELVESRAKHLLAALQGRMPGLAITQSHGSPGGEAFSSFIRGKDSPNPEGNKILYLVDGVEMDPFDIDFNEIESVSIFKDAAGVAMYGMRGSAGVILVTTKKGFVGKTKINVSLDQSLQSPTRFPEFVSAYDYAQMYNERLANDTMQGIGSGTDFYTQREMERYRLADSTEYYPVRDMVGDFIKPISPQTTVNVNFRGGTQTMKYFTSVSYVNEGSLFNIEPFEEYSYDANARRNRINFRTNIDLQLNKTLHAWANIGGYLEKVNRPYLTSGDFWPILFSKLYETPNNAYNNLTPDDEVLINESKLTYYKKSSVYGLLNRTGSSNHTTTRQINMFGAEQRLDNLVKGLSATAQLSFYVNSTGKHTRSRSYKAYQLNTLTGSQNQDSLGYSPVSQTNNSTLKNGLQKSFYYMYNFRGGLNYSRSFGDKHTLNGMVMAERHMQQRQLLLPTNFIGSGGRLAYGYSGKYFLEGTFAYHGSEQFSKDNRFGFFPAISGAWVISEESFLKENLVINYLKLRASHGKTGNTAKEYNGKGQYLYLDTWKSNATQVQLGNENIQWETSAKTNLGLEAKLYNSLYFEMDMFYNNNTDIIVSNQHVVPLSFMGISNKDLLPPVNLGQTINRGLELVIGYEKQVSKDLSFDFNAMFSYAKNEIIDVLEQVYDTGGYKYKHRKKGYSIDYRWGYVTDGLFGSQEEIDAWADQSALNPKGNPIPGDIKYVDVTGDGLVNEKDLSPLGRGATPEIIFGINASVRYKWLDLKVFVNGVANRSIYYRGIGKWSDGDNFTEFMKTAWKPGDATSGDEFIYPRLSNTNTNYPSSTIDYWMFNGSYIRIRNIELGVTLPANLLQKVGIGEMRFYVNGYNQFTFDKLPNKDFDPETVNSATVHYPIYKSWNFGVNLKF